MATDDYLTTLVDQLWEYRRRHFADCDYLFDEHREPNPPVFTQPHASCNVLLRPGAGPEGRMAVREAIPVSKRHRWFRSMKSSQALAQSVFANLVVHRKMGILSQLMVDGGEPLSYRRPGSRIEVDLEYEVAYLGERRRGRTNLDVLFTQGPYRIAVECKLTESEFGKCSRPLLKPEDANYCNGDYVRQQRREDRCSLSEIGVAYWKYIPQLFTGWLADVDQSPCPLNETYQLTRNLLAVCVRSDGSVDPASGHVVVLYDDRNPAFQESGEAGRVYDTVKNALQNPALLEKTTWQQVVACLRGDPEMAWLAQKIGDKYGIV